MAKDKRADDGRRAAFLAGLARGLSVSGAAAAAGVNRTLVYKWLKKPDFAGAWQVAAEAGDDLLEDEALRRALEGIEKPVFYRGEQVGTVRTYNDRLLMLLLQRRRPLREPSEDERRLEQQKTEIAVWTLLEYMWQYLGQRTACEERIEELTHALNEARRQLAEATPGAPVPEPLPVILPYDDDDDDDDDEEAAGDSPAEAAADTGSTDASGADDSTGDAAASTAEAETAVLSVSKCLPTGACPPGQPAPERGMPKDLRRHCAEIFGLTLPGPYPPE